MKPRALWHAEPIHTGPEQLSPVLGVPSWDAVTKGSSRKGASRGVWELPPGLAAAAGSAWWQCLVTPRTDLPPLLVTSPVPSPGAELGWDTTSALFAATDLLFYLHIISCLTMSSPTFSLIHVRSCPTSTYIPVASPPTTPKSFGSLPSSLHPITFQLSSHTSPFIQCPHSCPWGSSLLHMVLGDGSFQSFPPILPQCQQWHWVRAQESQSPRFKLWISQ